MGPRQIASMYLAIFSSPIAIELIGAVTSWVNNFDEGSAVVPWDRVRLYWHVRV